MIKDFFVQQRSSGLDGWCRSQQHALSPKCSHWTAKHTMQPAMGYEVDSDSYYRWEAPGKPVAVSLSLEVVERLGPALRQGGQASHRRAEIGGLLLGTVRRSGGLTVVEVNGFETIECEHAFGASYFLSGDEQRKLAERLHRRTSSGGATIVGFFRSNTRKEFALTIEDIDLMARHFPKPSMVLLLVHAAADGALRGGFSIWEQHAIRTMTPYVEFPFETSALLAGSHTICKRPREGAAGDGLITALLGSPSSWLVP